MPSVQSLTAQYPILICLSSWLSTLDLYHLSLTFKHFYSHIFASKSVFDHLKRTALCDGRGLKQPQNFEGPYELRDWRYVRSGRRKVWFDEPIEVQLWALKCDEAGALPCRRCGINICEQCRRTSRGSRIRPHLSAGWENENLFCLCEACDAKLEEELRGQFLRELCDCENDKRWLCSKCVDDEAKETQDMYDKYTVHQESDGWEELSDLTKTMIDHQFCIAFLCRCGGYVSQEARPRCTWCKRRHRPEDEWRQELAELRARPPPPEDPYYPIFVGDVDGDNRGKPYPKLAYDGPIWQAPDRDNS